MLRLAIACAVMMCLLENAIAQKPPGLITCTGAVPRATCDAVTTALEWRQQLPALHSVQFVIADAKSFEQERAIAGDYVFAGVINKTKPGSFTPAIHSSMDDEIIFEVTSASILKCPDRVIISTDLFQSPKKIGTNGTSMDISLVEIFTTFIHGYLEGCFGGRQVS